MLHQFCLFHNKKILFVRYKGHYNWQLLTEYLDYNDPISNMLLLDFIDYTLKKRLNIKTKPVEGMYKHLTSVQECVCYQKILKY